MTCDPGNLSQGLAFPTLANSCNSPTLKPRNKDPVLHWHPNILILPFFLTICPQENF